MSRPRGPAFAAAIFAYSIVAGFANTAAAQGISEDFLGAVVDDLRRQAERERRQEEGAPGLDSPSAIESRPLDESGNPQESGFSVDRLRDALGDESSSPDLEAAPVPEGAERADSRKRTPANINSATYNGGALPDGPSAITVKVQVLLDRAHVSPGVIDGVRGGMSSSAIEAFETSKGLTPDGIMDMQVWMELGGDTAGDIIRDYTLTPDDLDGLSAPLPQDYAELAELDWLGYTRKTEKIAEKFHMSEGFLQALNPNASFTAGETISVARVGRDLETLVTEVEVRKDVGRLAAFDVTGKMVANYPVTVGSSSTPSPSGTVEVVGVAYDPTYHYNPDNFVQGENMKPLTLPPGPNGPVGSIWIDLSKPSYGLHGTSNPATLFRNRSHGCVRLTNWDATELAGIVQEGTVVRFVE